MLNRFHVAIIITYLLCNKEQCITIDNMAGSQYDANSGFLSNV